MCEHMDSAPYTPVLMPDEKALVGSGRCVVVEKRASHDRKRTRSEADTTSIYTQTDVAAVSNEMLDEADNVATPVCITMTSPSTHEAGDDVVRVIGAYVVTGEEVSSDDAVSTQAAAMQETMRGRDANTGVDITQSCDAATCDDGTHRSAPAATVTDSTLGDDLLKGGVHEMKRVRDDVCEHDTRAPLETGSAKPTVAPTDYS